MLYLNRFFKALLEDPQHRPALAANEPLYIYKTVKLPDALSQFRKSQQHMAVVTDEYGGTLGIVTLEDVLEHWWAKSGDETTRWRPRWWSGRWRL